MPVTVLSSLRGKTMAKEPKTSQKTSLSSESTQTPSTQRMVLRARTTEPRKRSTRLRSDSDEEARVVSAKKSKTKQKKSKKKQSKSFDSKKPKKPPTAFFYFLEDFRKEFQEQNPEIKSMRDVGKACGEKWKTMTYEEKVQYYDIATEKRAEFDTAMEEYLERKESGDYEATEDDSEFDEEEAKD